MLLRPSQNKDDTGAVGDAFSQVFHCEPGSTKSDEAPATTATMLISDFVDDLMLVEIELDAVVG